MLAKGKNLDQSVENSLKVNLDLGQNLVRPEDSRIDLVDPANTNRQDQQNEANAHTRNAALKDLRTMARLIRIQQRKDRSRLGRTKLKSTKLTKNNIIPPKRQSKIETS